MFLFQNSTIGKRTEPLEERHAQLHELGWRLPHQQCRCLLCQNDSNLDLELPDMSVVEKLLDIIEKPPKRVTLAEAIDFIHDAIAYLNANNAYHPKFNTTTVQNGLFIFWHLFPELV